MINAIIGTLVFFFLAGIVASLVKKFTDFIISLLILACVVLVFVAGFSGTLGETLGTAALLAIALPLITLPLWPISDFGKEILESDTKSVIEAWKELVLAVVDLFRHIILSVIDFFRNLFSDQDQSE